MSNLPSSNRKSEKGNSNSTTTACKPPLKHQAISFTDTIHSEMTIESRPSIDIFDEDNQEHRHALIRSAFSLSKDEEIVGDFPCYLVRLVTLPGWIYLTNERICYFAPLPGKEESPKKEGYLTKKNHKTSPRSFRYYFILQYHVVSWYQSAESHYEPLGNIELKNVTDIQESKTRKLGFKIITPSGRYTFIADSEVSKKEWLDDLRRGMFMAKNEGNTVRIVLPFTKTASVTKASAFEFAEYIKVSVSDSCQQYGNKLMDGDDEYYFAFFPDINEAFNLIQSHWKKQRHTADTDSSDDFKPSRSSSAEASHDEYKDDDDDDEFNHVDAADPITAVSTLATFGDRENENTRSAGSNYLMSAFSKAACASPLPNRDSDNDDTFDTAFKRGPTVHIRQQEIAARDTSILFKKTLNQLSESSHALSNAVLATKSSLMPVSFTNDEDTSHSSTPDSIASALVNDNNSDNESNKTNNKIDKENNNSSNDTSKPKRVRSGSLKAIKHYATLPFHQLASIDCLPGAKWKTNLALHDDPSTSTLSSASPQQQQQQQEPSTPVSRKRLSLPAAPHLLQLAAPLTSSFLGGSTEQHGMKRKVDVWLCAEIRQQLGMEAIVEYGNDGYQTALNDEVKKHFPMLGVNTTVNALYRTSVWRMIPYYGWLYFVQGYACFHASVLAGQQMIIVPFTEIINLRKLRSRGYHLLHGLGVTTKDMNEEIFFEFSSIELRDSCFALFTLESQRHLNDERDSSESDKEDANSSPSHRKSVQLEHVIPPSQYNGPPLLSTLPGTEQRRRHNRWAPKPLNITCLTIGSRGDVQPYIALCLQLQQDGHHCRIASHEEYKDWVKRYGIEFRSIGGDPGKLMKLCIENDFLSFSFIKSGYKFFYTWFETLLETGWEACQGTDVLIESPSAMIGIHLAEKLEIPYFRSMPFPWTRTTKFPHPFATPNHAGGRIYNDMTYVMIEIALWAGTSRTINRFRRERLGLAPTTLEQLELWRVPYLYSFSSQVQPVPKDWPDYVHCTGYWFLDDKLHSNTDKWTPPPALLRFLRLDSTSSANDNKNGDEDQRPVVYIGFGSIIVSDPVAMSQVIAEAVVEANVRAIVCKGWSSRIPASRKQKRKEESSSSQILQQYPDSIFEIDSIPHDWLFPLIQGVVHHGGAGTCAAGLRAGLPTIIKPFFGDQRFWGQRVEDLGVGICMPKLIKSKLKQHLITITQDTTMKNKVKLLGEAIRQESGTKTAVDCLYRDMGLAKRAKQVLGSASVSPTASTDELDEIPSETNVGRTGLYSYAKKWKQ